MQTLKPLLRQAWSIPNYAGLFIFYLPVILGVICAGTPSSKQIALSDEDSCVPVLCAFVEFIIPGSTGMLPETGKPLENKLYSAELFSDLFRISLVSVL